MLIDDYEYISSCIEIYSQRLEAMIPTVNSLIQIFDSQQSLKETANISRLTYLALAFIPLTFVSGLLSMNETGMNIFWRYLIIAIPVSTTVFFIARPPQRILDFFAACIRIMGRRKHKTAAKNGIIEN